MKEQALVLSVEKRHAVVLLPGGAFCKIPLGDRTLIVGQEIAIEAPSRAWIRVPVSLGAALVLGVALLLPGWLHSTRVARAASIVSVDFANASINLMLGADRRVVSARGFNATARRMLQETPVIGLPVSRAVINLTEDEVSHQKIHQNQLVVVGGVGPIAQSGQLKTITSQESQYAHKKGIKLSVVPVASSQKDVASQVSQAPVSVGRYLLWKKRAPDRIPDWKAISNLPLSQFLEQTKPSPTPTGTGEGNQPGGNGNTTQPNQPEGGNPKTQPSPQNHRGDGSNGGSGGDHAVTPGHRVSQPGEPSSAPPTPGNGQGNDQGQGQGNTGSVLGNVPGNHQGSGQGNGQGGDLGNNPGNGQGGDQGNGQGQGQKPAQSPSPSKPQPHSPAPHNGGQGFLGGLWSRFFHHHSQGDQPTHPSSDGPSPKVRAGHGENPGRGQAGHSGQGHPSNPSRHQSGDSTANQTGSK